MKNTTSSALRWIAMVLCAVMLFGLAASAGEDVTTGAAQLTASQGRQYVALTAEETDRINFLLSGLGLSGDFVTMYDSITGKSPSQWTSEEFWNVFADMVYRDMSYTLSKDEDTSHLAQMEIYKEYRKNGYNTEAVYSLNEMQKLVISAFGRSIPELPDNSGLSMTGSELFFPMADGGGSSYQFVDTAYFQGGRFFVEGVSLFYSNGGNVYTGRFVAELQPNEQSLLGYTLLSFDRAADPKYVSGLTASASSVHPDELTFTYVPSVALDGDFTTAWIEGVEGDGQGEWIMLSSGTPFTFSGVMIGAGYQKDASVYEKNGRPVSLIMECSDGTSWQLTNLYDWGGSLIPLGRTVTATWVRFTIGDVETGTKYQDTCISEIQLMEWTDTEKKQEQITVPVPSVTPAPSATPVPSTTPAPSAPSTTPAPAAPSTAPEMTLYCCASDYVTLRTAADRASAKITTIASREPVKYLGTAGEFFYVSYNGQNGYVLQDFFSLDPNAPLNFGSGSAKVDDSITLYCRASDYVTLRSIADRSGAALAYVYTGQEVKYLGAVGEFYYVSFNGQNGYVLQEFFSTNPNAPLNYGTGSVAKTDGIWMYCCASESATLRATPSRDGEELTQIPSRDAVQYVSTVGEFYLVYYKGQGGYVLKDFFSTDPFAALNFGSGSSEAPGETILYCIASDSATLRNIAARSGTALAAIPSRAAVTYISTVGEFYYVSYNGQNGYALKSYFSTDPNAPLNYGTR